MTASMQQPVHTRVSSQRVRNAREALLDDPACALVQPVRDIICEPTRMQIVRALTPGPLAVGELAATLGRSKSSTSQHLRVLRDAGVVSSRRRGRTVMNSLCSAPMVAAAVQVLESAATLSSA